MALGLGQIAHSNLQIENTEIKKTSAIKVINPFPSPFETDTSARFYRSYLYKLVGYTYSGIM